LTDEWKNRGIREPKDFAILTAEGDTWSSETVMKLNAMLAAVKPGFVMK
jgi:hypothetical protein